MSSASKKHVEVKEEAMEVESTTVETKTQKTPKRNSQAKLTSFFGSAVKGNNAADKVSGSDGLKSPKKEKESPVKRKSGEGEKKETGKNEKRKSAIKVEIKEEPMEEEEEESGSEEYEVEKIISHEWTNKGVLKYKVKWVGYEEEKDQTMEPEANLDTAMEKVEEYLMNLPQKTKDEYERKTGKKIETTSKGAKKRPISETLTTPSSNGKKKGKKNESEKENKKNSVDGSKQKKSKKNVLKTPKGQVKKESMTPEERIEVIEKTRQKAYDLSAEDHLGMVIQKATESLIDMIKYDADPQKMTSSTESLKNERTISVEADRKKGTTDPLRDIAYTLCEKLEQALTCIASRERRLAKIKQEAKEEGGDGVSLVAVSTVEGVKGVEVKEEMDEY